MKPIWLLDVDGVLNAIRPTEGSKWPMPYEIGRANGYTIKWSPALISRICQLYEHDLVEIRWCTTWELNANAFISPLLGLPQFPVETSEVHKQSWWWKFEIAKLVAEERPLIWTDDDLTVAGHWHEWSARRPNLLAIAPDWRVGLQPDHMDEITRFVLQHASREGDREELDESLD